MVFEDCHVNLFSRKKKEGDDAMSRNVTGNTEMLAVIGSPVRHSNSPALHNAAFDALELDYEYLAFDVGVENLPKALEGLRVLGAKGFSVTMPLKQAAWGYMDELSTEAELCGSVNCVLNREGRLIGYNTDGYGFIQTLRQNDVTIKGSKMTLIGTGGVSAAICTQAALDGMREIVLFGIKDPTFVSCQKLVERLNERTDCKVQLFELSEEKLLKQHISESDILANATPVGMGKMEGKSPVNDASLFRAGLSVMDVIYNPEKTRFLEMAEASGCKIMNGKDMLLLQGAGSFKIWTGKDMPEEVMRSCRY